MTLHRKIYKNVRASIFLMYNGKVTCFTSYKNERRDLSNTIFINHINIGKAATSIGLLTVEQPAKSPIEQIPIMSLTAELLIGSNFCLPILCDFVTIVYCPLKLDHKMNAIAHIV